MKNFLRKAVRCWNWKKPLAMFRLALMFFRVKVQKKMMLRYVDLSIGEKCNMACPHCFVGKQAEIQKKRKKDERRISPEYYGKVVSQAMSLGACSFSLQGGEPLIYEDLPKYIKAAKPHLNLISITTNGKALDYEMACQLRRWGVDIVTISIDAFRREADNDQALSAVFTAMRAGLKVTIGTVVSRSCLQGELFRDLCRISQRCNIVLMVMMAVPMGALEGKESEMLTDVDVKFLRELENTCPTIQTDFKVNWIEENCGAGREILYIKHTGEVYACPYIPISFGNVGRHSLQHIRDEVLKCEVINNNRHLCIAGEKGGLFTKITEKKHEKRV